MIKSPVASKLFKLVKTIRENKEDFSNFQKGEAHKRNELYTRTKGEITKYEQGIKGMSWSTEYFAKEDIFWIDFAKYIKRLGEKHTILIEAQNVIQDQFKLKEKAAQAMLGRFINYILFEEHHALSDERAIEIVAIFIKDMHKTPPDWKVKLWINGIWLEEKQIEINDELLIRKPVNDDFDFTKPAFTLFDRFTSSHIDNCDAIMELKYFNTEFNELNEYLDKLVKAFRLYRVGSVQIIRREYIPNSIIINYGVPVTLDSKVSSHSYEIKKEDNKRINDFLNIILPFLPDRNWQNEESPQNPIYIAIERYMEALIKIQSQESKITNIITCLEALFLKTKERSELNHKLSQRVSFLVSVTGIPPLKIYKVLKRSYDIRSTFIHGSMLKLEEKKDLKEISDTIIDFARLSILSFIEMSNKYEKEDILTKIDNALLDISANEKLKAELKELEIIKLTAGNNK